MGTLAVGEAATGNQTGGADKQITLAGAGEEIQHQVDEWVRVEGMTVGRQLLTDERGEGCEAGRADPVRACEVERADQHKESPAAH